MRVPGVGLLRDGGFRSLWSATTISEVGTQLSGIALPLLVIQTLHASTLAVGLLTACETAAFLLVGLPAGAVVDRLRRRPVLIAADVCRAILLASLPVAWWLGVLTFAHVVVVALLAGLFTVFFDVAYQSYLPTLVGRTHLVEANAKLEVSASSAAVAGPAIGGVIVQLLAAPVAIAADAVSYVASAVLVGRIRATEPPPTAPPQASLVAQVAEGLRFVMGHPLLRAIAMSTGVFNFFASIVGAVFVVFLVRTLHQPAGTVGVVLTVGAVGGVIGALSAGWFARRVGQARAIWLGPLLAAPCFVLLPLAQPGPRLALAAVGQLAATVGLVYYNVAQVSLRQVITPAPLLGRMNASMRFLVWGPRPLGAVVGGVLGSAIGVRPTIWVGVLATQLGLVPVLLSPLRRMREAPRDEEAMLRQAVTLPG